MSTTVAPVPEASPSLSEPQRIAGIFYQPSKVFADVRTRSSWWAPFLLMSVISLMFVFSVDKKITFAQIQQNMYGNMSEKQKDRMEQMTPQQKEQQQTIMLKSLKYISYVSPLFLLIFAALCALVLMSVFNFGLAAQASFSQSLGVVMYSFVPGILKTLLAIVLIFAGMNPENFNYENPVATNPAMLTSPGEHPALYKLLASFDIFTIWTVILMGIGFAVISNKKIKPGTGITVMLAVYAFVRIITVGWAAMMG